MSIASSVSARISKASGLAVLPFLLAPTAAMATDFNAGVVMTQMKPEERYPFLLGVIEGLSYARYQKDGKSIDGMKCMYDWFLTEGSTAKIYDAFEKFPDSAPAAVVLALLESECGT